MDATLRRAPGLRTLFFFLFAVTLFPLACAPRRPVTPEDTCSPACGKGQRCAGGRCVCAETDPPCRVDCSETDPGCTAGVQDAESCACVPLGRTRLTEIWIEPAPVVLTPGEFPFLRALARLDDGRQVDVSRSVDWSVGDLSVASLTWPGRLEGVEVGRTTVFAASGEVVGEAPVEVVPAAPVELRGLWVTRWNYDSPADVERIFEQAAAAGFNAIFFQVRGTADAYYDSSLEPWAERLTGTLGEDPGWDPLAVAIESGRREGLEVHAWLNTVPAWSGATPPAESTPRHIYLAHPEWIMQDASGTPMPLGDGYVCVSPGIPEVQDHIVAVVEDLLSKYAVDGIHLDYIRYYGPQYSHDPVSLARYEAARAADPTTTFEDWQRDQVTELVRRVYQRVRQHPGVRLTAAVWHNNDLDVTGSSGYRDYYQDSHRWTREGIIDAIVPMTYFRLDSDPGFAALVDDHLTNGRNGRHVYVGVHAYGRGRGAEVDTSGQAMLENIAYARQAGADGIVVFAYPYLDESGLFGVLADGPFSEPARPPGLPWREP
ncbi:MAG: hypothetical protein D6729_05085 [Deltaproteobacteria bacterium]|nr:MAG: hypothetical protein D6729_05085 [Deltaproteobacteria bacterium]